jgi:hypothetical protein
MTREELQLLSWDQLIDLILQQHALIQQLSAQVATLETRVAEREAPQGDWLPQHQHHLGQQGSGPLGHRQVPDRAL